MSIIKYISRYVVPFYFNNENNGYDRLVSYFETNDKITDEKLRMPKDACWVNVGFWENYKSSSDNVPEMDTYSYLIDIIKNSQDKNDSNLGCSFVVKSGGSLLKIKYKVDENKAISINCNELGVVVFRNGIGFIWYDVEISKIETLDAYYKFQNAFKELARTQNDEFFRTIGKEKEEKFFMGAWLADVLCTEQNGIRFWVEKKINVDKEAQMVSDKAVTQNVILKAEKVDIEEKIVPDKALMYQYLFVDKLGDNYRHNIAFRLANGYDKNYNPPKTIRDNVYEPFGNMCFFVSKSGMSCVVSDNNTNRTFFEGNFARKFTGDYFFHYILILYQTYSCSYYSKMLTKLPADVSIIEKNNKYVDELECLDTQINLFIVKSVYGSVSNIQHQNGAYQYARRMLLVDEEIRSLTVGLGALRIIEKEKEKALEEEENRKKDKLLNEGIITFGFLVVISTCIDALNVVDWFHGKKPNKWHILLLIIIGIVTLFMIKRFYDWYKNKK